MLASFVGLFFQWQYGLLGLLTFIAGFWFAYKTGKELDVQTVGQLAKKITRDNYLKSRRDPNTFNKEKIEKILTNWFSDDFDIDKSKLTRGAVFRWKLNTPPKFTLSSS